MLKYFSTFSGIGGFELGIRLAHENNLLQQKQGRKDNLSPEGRERSKYLEATVWEPEPVCVGFSEIDKYATQIYQRHFPTHHNYGDITKIKEEELPDFDLFVGGFPCQSFSIAGHRRGFEDARGTLFFEIARILKSKQPRHLLLENVKGLLSHDNGRTFTVIIATLDELGYDLQWQVLNSKNHGVPQNRERVFIVGHLRGTSRPEVFPFGEDDGGIDSGESFVSGEVQANGEERNITDSDSEILQDGTDRSVCVGTLRTHKDGKGFREIKSGISPTIPARAREDGSGQPVVAYTLKARADSGIDEKHPQTLIIQKQGNNVESEKYVEKDIVGAIKATNQNNPRSGGTSLVVRPVQIGQGRDSRAAKSGTIVGEEDAAYTVRASQPNGVFNEEEMSVRRLTPTECERLQGFPDGWTEGISDTQRYKCCGNAVTVNVIRDICERLLR